MIHDVRYLLSTFAAGDRRQLLLSVLAQFLLAVMDLLGVASIFPLMQVLTGASIDEGSLGTVHSLLGSQDERGFVLSLAGIMVASFVLKALFALAITWWSNSLVTRLQTETARRLLSVYMNESYLVHRRRNTGELMRTVGTAVTDAHSKVLGGIISALTSLLSIVAILGLLLVVSPIPTLCALVYFGAVVFVIQRVLGPANRRAGEEAQMTSWVSSHALVDAMQGFREAVLHNARDHFIDRYDTANKRTARAALRANYFSTLPKYLLEVVTMVGLTAYIVATILTGTASSAMPTLSLFVAATVKLLPVMVALTATLGMIRVGHEGLAITVAALREAGDQHAPNTQALDLASVNGSVSDIVIDDVTFRYPDGDRDVLSQIDLRVPAGTSLALCGASGSGKTTMVDIILGLIEPTEGEVTYAGVPTTRAGEEWYEHVAYVPQDVYIMDASLAANVAFGRDEAGRDDARVLRCLEQAALGDLVRTLPDGLDTLVGERGNRLSGGQRQRIGIARALYRRPQIMVLDEATSALDNETESRITQTLASVRGQVTTIVVAHRLSTVRHVDHLAFLADGRVEAAGTFEQVRDTSASFARLVALGRLED